MAILTPVDASIYAPDVTLTGDALDSALLFVQSLIESASGANRPLEIQPYTERKRLNINGQTTFFSYLPVLEDPVPIVRVRLGNLPDLMRQVIPVGEWQSLEADSYTIDIDGRLNLNENFYRYFNYGYYGSYDHRNRYYASEAELIYSSGYDFTQSTPEVIKLKASAGRILSWVYGGNAGVYQGVKRLKVPFREFEVEYSDKSPPGQVPRELFLPFVRYRPIST